MREKKLIKKQLIKNMLYSFITFSIIFTIFGVIIFNNLKNELYKAVDTELFAVKERYNNIPKNDKNLKLDSIMQNEQIQPTNEQIQSTEDLPKPIKNNMPNININPRITYILRDSNGNILNQESIGRFYDEYYNYIEFNSDYLDKVYELKLNNYAYRVANFKVQDMDGNTRYIQLLINIDAENNIIDNYLNILTLGIVITVILSILASYVLSKKALKPIIESWQKQTEFVQNASHELRTPLTIIQAKQELLLQEPNSKIIDKSEDIRLSLNEAKRLTKLTKDLMLLARADSNKIELTKEEINIDELIKEIVIPYKDFAETQEKEIILNLNYNQKILIDRNRIHQLMVILLDNSIKYTGNSEKIEVSTYNKDGKCVIEVKDTGIGISDKTIQMAFDRFYREDKARSRETGGSGLGLSIAHFIVTSHNGTIKISHNEPKGTIVTVKLPK